jgi:hypothetical protein
MNPGPQPHVSLEVGDAGAAFWLLAAVSFGQTLGGSGVDVAGGLLGGLAVVGVTTTTEPGSCCVCVTGGNVKVDTIVWAGRTVVIVVVIVMVLAGIVVVLV